MFQIFYRAKKSEVLTFLNRRGGRRTVTVEAVPREPRVVAAVPTQLDGVEVLGGPTFEEDVGVRSRACDIGRPVQLGRTPFSPNSIDRPSRLPSGA